MNKILKVLFLVLLVYTAYDLYEKHLAKKPKEEISVIKPKVKKVVVPVEKNAETPKTESMMDQSPTPVTIQETKASPSVEVSNEDAYPSHLADQISDGTLVSCETLRDHCEPKPQDWMPSQDPEQNVKTICVTHAINCERKSTVQGVFKEEDIYTNDNNWDLNQGIYEAQ